MTDPRPSGPVRRASDATFWPLALVGLLVAGAGVALKIFSDASDTLVISLVGIGCSLIPGNHLIDALRAWKGQSNG